MKRTSIGLVGLWIAAVCVVALLYFRQETPSTPPRALPPDVPLRTPDRDRAPRDSATVIHRDVAQGPPRMIRGDARHTGRSGFIGPRAPTKRFRFETRGPISSQAVVGNDGNIYVGSHDGFVYALRASGEELWRVALDDRVYMTPYVDEEGSVFVGSDADVYVKIRRGGEVAWRLMTEGDADTATTPGPDGTLHFAAGNDVWAVQPDGTARWRFRARGKIYTAPAIDADGTIYVGSQDDSLYAIAPDGRMRWQFATRGDNDASPAIGDDGTIYFGSDDRHVYAVGRDGALRWKTYVDGYVRAPAALFEDVVVCGVFGPRARVVALDAGDGRLLWEFPVTVAASGEVGVASGPLIDREGHIYVGAHDDFVYSLTRSGSLRWAFQLGGDVDAPPVLGSDGTLIIGSDDHALYALHDGGPIP